MEHLDGVQEEFATETPVVEDTAKVTWNLPGTDKEVSKSEFIRHMFSAENMSRKEISEKYDIPYRTVYGATINLENGADPTSRGRAATNAKITVLAGDTSVVVASVVEENGATVVTYNGEVVEADLATLELLETDRNVWIKEQVALGVARGDIAKYLGISYGVVYGVTKDAEGGRNKHMVEVDGEMIPRSEYIRQLFAAGVSKADIAKQLEVEYSVVWQATKQEKTAQDKFADAIAKVEAFEDVIPAEGKEFFAQAIEWLKGINIPAEEVAAEEVVAEEATN